MNSLTYNQVVADIVKLSATGDAPETQEQVRVMCQAFRDVLVEFTQRSNGYMMLAAFLVSFDEMKKVISVAESRDKQLITELVQAIIGSFGRSVQ